MKLVVHLHLYYLEQLTQALAYLRALDGQPYDLFVTMTEENPKAEQTIKAFHPDTVIMTVPNHGYDLGPFIEFLHRVDLNAYDLILKIHTKSPTSKNFTVLNGYSMTNRLWNYVLWDSVLGSKKQVQNCLKQFENKDVGMVGSKHCLTNEKRTYEELLPGINNELVKSGFEKVTDVRFIAGTMFYTRAFLMKPLLMYSLKDFDITNGAVKNGTLAHVMERMLAEIVTQKGYKIVGQGSSKPVRLFFKFHMAQIIHFLWQNKRTKSGSHIIKICRIPVYHKKGYQNV